MRIQKRCTPRTQRNKQNRSRTHNATNLNKETRLPMTAVLMCRALYQPLPQEAAREATVTTTKPLESLTLTVGWTSSVALASSSTRNHWSISFPWWADIFFDVCLFSRIFTETRMVNKSFLFCFHRSPTSFSTVKSNSNNSAAYLTQMVNKHFLFSSLVDLFLLHGK